MVKGSQPSNSLCKLHISLGMEGEAPRRGPASCFPQLRWEQLKSDDLDVPHSMAQQNIPFVILELHDRLQ